MKAGRSQTKLPDDRWYAIIYRDIIMRWERELKTAKFPLFAGSKYQLLEKELGITRKSFETEDQCHAFCEEKLRELKSPYIVLSTNKKRLPHVVFRRIRNAFAHARFEIDGQWLYLSDEVPGRGTVSMRARIKANDLERLLTALLAGVELASHPECQHIPLPEKHQK